MSVGPFSVDGGNEVINNLQSRLTGAPFQVVFGPSTRRIIDMNSPDQSIGINPTGQSGYFFDKHYKDQAHLFHNNQYRAQSMNLNHDTILNFIAM